MSTFTTVIIWIDIAFAAFFLLKLAVPSIVPAIESVLIKIFKKGNKND